MTLLGFRGHAFRGTGRDDPSAVGSAPGTEIDDVVGIRDDVEVVLDHDAVAPAARSRSSTVQQDADVEGVQAHRGLVEDEQRPGLPRPSSVASFSR